MCGIVAALPSYDRQLLETPDAREILASLPVLRLVGAERDAAVSHDEFARLNTQTQTSLQLLGRAGSAAVLLADPAAFDLARQRADALVAGLAELDGWIDECSGHWGADVTETVQIALRSAQDGAYNLRHDRLEPIARIARLRPATLVAPPTAVVGYLAVDRVLAAIDRLEVRGRDSAGVSIWVQLDPADLLALPAVEASRRDPNLSSGSVRSFAGGRSFVYKRAAVVGRLGDNVARLRAEITTDDLLHLAMARPSARVTVLAHTRWASVGRISEPNAHPVDNWVGDPDPQDLVFAALNGDIDNHRDLRRQHNLGEDGIISTDAKLVPVRLAEFGCSGTASSAMAAAIGEFDGSMAIAAQLSSAPNQLVLAVKGSGQGLYVGLAETGFTVASEVYGLVAGTRDYLRLDGGVRAGATSAGEVVRLDLVGSGTLAGLERFDGDGHPVPVALSEVRRAELTTRDLALGGANHYLQKEIGEAASAFRKTLRGRVRLSAGTLSVDLPESSVSADLRARLIEQKVRRITVLGQGTAAVASQGIAQVMTSLLGARIQVRATPATEFSAYDLEPDLSDTLVIAISQSGSTTDTNRTVDLARARGAHVIAIINRRDSDLASKSNGLLYTSDGRDVEMAVASTKAFYAQVAAGCLLGLQLGTVLGVVGTEREDTLLRALQEMPAQLRELHAGQDAIAAVARATATRHQNWAVVGSGPNRVAAAEARIKLSELCYRTVSTDAIEDKKHIDLSAESLVLVCTAGTPPGQIRDIKKEVEIFSAHRNVPVVITDADESEEWPTPHIIRVPAAHPVLAWILSTAATHLFSYHAAVSIDAAAADLRIALAELESATPTAAASSWRIPVAPPLNRFLDRVSADEIVGLVSPRTLIALTVAAADVASPLLSAPSCFADQIADPEEFVRSALTAAIDELTRSIDSVKHQAKTVTVGTSRDDADLYDNAIVAALREVGCDPALIFSHATLVTMNEHAPLLTEIRGITRYRLRGQAKREIVVTGKTGVSVGLRSRSEQWSALIGSKELVARTRRPRLLRGAGDGRLVFVIPEQEGSVLGGLSVVHLDLAKTATGSQLVAALSTTGDRLDELRAAITESGLEFSADLLEGLPVEDVLLAPVDSLASVLMLTS